MDPHIVRHIDKALLQKAVALYQKKYSEITEEDWELIMEYRDLVRLSILHLYPPIKDLKHITKSVEENLSFSREYEAELNENFQKRFEFYVRMLKNDKNLSKLKITLQLKNDITNGHWDKVFSTNLPVDIEHSVINLFWIKLFRNINFNEKGLQEVDNRFKYMLEKIINNVFSKDEKKNAELTTLLNDSKNYDLIIQHICKVQVSYDVLALYPEQIKKLNRENTHPYIFLTSLLQAQQIFHENKLKSLFLRDAKRGTTVVDINITSDLRMAEEERKRITLQQVIDELSNINVNDKLIKYIILYTHQDGISQAGSNFFQRENFNLGFTFIAKDKQVRIEVISPTQIRVLSPVVYNSYSEISDQVAAKPKEHNKSIFYEFTSILIEVDENNTQSQLGVKVSVDDCFCEATDQEISSKMQTAVLKKIISKQINHKELEKYENMVMQPFIAASQGLINLSNAPAGVLIILMLSNYKYAIEIMKDEKLRNKILNSEFNTNLFNVYNLHANIEEFIRNDNKLLWNRFISGKRMLDSLLAILNEIAKISTDNSPTTDKKRYLNRLVDEKKTIFKLILKQDFLYDIFRSFSIEDQRKLLAFPDIKKLFRADQLAALQNFYNDNNKSLDVDKNSNESAGNATHFLQNINNKHVNQIKALYAQYLTESEYSQLAKLYLTNKKISAAVDAHPVLLKKLIENVDIVLLNEMLLSNRSLAVNIIQSFTTNASFRDRILGKSELNMPSIGALQKLIVNLLATLETELELVDLVQLINVYRINIKIDLFDIVKDHPLMLNHDIKSIEKLFDINAMSPMKRFLAMDQNIKDDLLKNDPEKILQLINTSTSKELNLLFSSHSNLLHEWTIKISSASANITNKIRLAVMNNLNSRELADLYLYTNTNNQIIILANKHLIEKMFTDKDKLAEIYIYNQRIRPMLENNDVYVNFMMSADYSGREWFEIYLKASSTIRQKIVVDDKILDKLILMTSQNNLLQIIRLQPELANNVSQKIFDYYINTEYMRSIVNRQPELLHKMIWHLDPVRVTLLLTSHPDQDICKVIEETKKLDKLNIDQILLLLSDGKSNVYNILLNNKACCTLFLKSERSPQSQVPQNKKVIEDILERYPDLYAFAPKKLVEKNLNLPKEIIDEINTVKRKMQSNSNGVNKDSPNIGIKSSS